MIDDLLPLLERINKLPLTAEERAELMRAALEEHRGGKKPGPKPRTGPNSGPIAAAIRDVMADGEWRQISAIRTALAEDGRPIAASGVNSAMRDMWQRGVLERKEDGIWPTGKPMIWYRLPLQAKDE